MGSQSNMLAALVAAWSRADNMADGRENCDLCEQTGDCYACGAAGDASGATAKGIVSCAPVLADARNATPRVYAGNAMGREIVLAVWAG